MNYKSEQIAEIGIDEDVLILRHARYGRVRKTTTRQEDIRST